MLRSNRERRLPFCQLGTQEIKETLAKNKRLSKVAEMIILIRKLNVNEVSPRGLLLFMSYKGMCGPLEYGFRPFWSEMGY